MLNRREFVIGTAALSAVGIARAAFNSVSIVADPSDPIIGAQPIRGRCRSWKTTSKRAV